MAEIVQVNGKPAIDYTARDYTSMLAALRDQIPLKLPEWTDFTNEADFGNVLLELFAYVGDILSYYQDRIADECYLRTATSRRSVIDHLRLIGYRMRTASPAAAVLTLSIPGNVEPDGGAVRIHRGAAFATRSNSSQPSIRFEYTGAEDLDLIFKANDSGSPKAAQLTVEEGRLITDEVLGVADGSPGQRYSLGRPGVILRPGGNANEMTSDISCTTREGGQDAQSWLFRETLAYSGNTDRHFSVDIDEYDRATIVFGDQTFGAAPPRGAVVSATYRIGGGIIGNVPAGAIAMIVDEPALTKLTATVTNPTGATGGEDRETIPHAVEHAPRIYRSGDRAVTVPDFEELALTYPGVGKVRAVATAWNTVTLFVAPAGGGGAVSDALELGLKRFFEPRRMLTQTIEIADVDYVAIYVTAEIGIESWYVPENVKADVERAVATLLAFDKVNFGETLYLSRFYDAIQSTEGVMFANITEFRGEGRKPLQAESGRISLSANELPVRPAQKEYKSGINLIDPQGLPT
ncbi:MAG: putative baseplate assembly protein [Pseudonocardia sp.]|nr:MAG: putative baseplate assembly protein [Pseudonocardia sp.]